MSAPRFQTIRCRDYGYYGARARETDIAVEFRAIRHWMYRDDRNDFSFNPAGGRWTAYEVVVNGRVKGTVEQSTISTDRHYGRIRVPGKGRVGWSWRKKLRRNQRDERYRTHGSGEHSRASAAAHVLGYETGTAV